MNRLYSYIRDLFFGLVLFPLFVTEVSAQNPQVDLELVKATVEQWSEAHNNKDRSTFEKLYAPALLFYTQELSQKECIRIKFNRLNSAKFYSQKITTSLINTFYKSGIIRCDFTTEVTVGSKVTEYDSYLLLERNDNVYQIVGESDLVTDRKKNYQLALGEQYKINELEIVDFPEMTFGVSSKMISIILWLIPAPIALVILIFLYLKVYRKRKKKKITNPHDQVALKNDPSEIVSSRRFQEKKDHGSEAAIKKKKGDEFEAYIFERFDRKNFTIRYWNSDLMHKGVYPESNMYPDLEIEFKYTDFKRVFAVECKFRSNLLNNSFELKTRQLNNYRKYALEKSIRVYIAVGLSGKPSNPKKLYLIPLEIFNDRNSLSYRELASFERGTNYFRYDRTLDMLR